MSFAIQIAVCRLPPQAVRNHPQLADMARGLKHYWLAQHTGECSSALRWGQAAHGKPVLIHPAGWHFNLSHSRDTAVIALARQAVGVDVEYAKRRANWQAIGARMFQSQENQQLQAMPAGQVQRATVQLWTAKEAWAKATGLGIARMEQAPTMRWNGACWKIAQPTQDLLLQAQLWDDMLFSLWFPSQPQASLQWQALTWQGDDRFMPAPSLAVTELRA